MDYIELVVEQAGCSSCAARVRAVLEEIAVVDAVDVDEDADVASVRLHSPQALAEETVASVLREASAGSGHEYRVRPGSWRTGAD